MGEYERTFTVNVPAGDAFRYLSSVDNLVDFVPYLQSLREEEDDHVFGVIDFGEGRRAEASGFFRTYPAEMRLDWESDGTPGYQGWLNVEPQGRDRARVTAHISMPGGTAEAPLPDPALASDRVERAFDSAVRAIRETIESQALRTRRAG